MNKFNNLFYKKYKNQDNKETNYIKRDYLRILKFLLFLFIILFSFYQINFTFNIKGIDEFKENLSDFFKASNYDHNYPSNTLLENSILFMWKTLLFTTLGTCVGFALALITTFFTSKVVFPKGFTFVVDLITIFLRSFPALIVIFLIKQGFEKSLAASLILFWFSWLWSNRYLQDIFNNTDKGEYFLYLKKGYSKFFAFYKSIFRKNANKIIMIFFFSLESNLRFSAILGSFSLTGIGILIDINWNENKYSNLTIPVLVLVFMIFLFELIIFAFNRWILCDSTKEINDKYIRNPEKTKINVKNIIKISFLILLITISIYQLSIINWKFIMINNLINHINIIFKPDISLWQNEFTENPWIDIVHLLINGIFIIFISFCLSLIFSFLGCSKIMPSYIFLPLRFINVLFRSIPTLIIFIFINPLFLDQTLIGILAISFGTTSILTKQFTESFNTISKSKIEIYRKKGKSYIWIFIFYMFFENKKDLYSYTYFAYNNALRTLVVLGIFGVSIIGSNINGFQKRNEWTKISACIWPLIITLLTLELIPKINLYFRVKNLKYILKNS